jgi:hypothetical protein
MLVDWDADDPPPLWAPRDYFWQYMNRAAEWSLRIARFYGWKEEKMLNCEAPGCMSVASMRKKFRDPRRGTNGEVAYTVRHFCSPECELEIVDELERQANYMQLASSEDAARKVS